MTENGRRNTENSRREAEKMSLVEAIRDEMAWSVRSLGGDGNAAQQNYRAARHTGLPVTVIERLRWKKFKRIPADIADVVRQSLLQHTEKQERIARHENEILKAKLAAALARHTVGSSDPDFDREAAAQIRRQFAQAFGASAEVGGVDRPLD